MSWTYSFYGTPDYIAREVKSRVDSYFSFDAVAAVLAVLERLKPGRNYNLTTTGHEYAGVIENINVNFY